MSDENLVVVKTVDESCVSDLPKSCASVELVSELFVLPDWDDCNCHERRQHQLHARMWSPPTIARYSRRAFFISQRASLSAHKDDRKRMR